MAEPKAVSWGAGLESCLTLPLTAYVTLGTRATKTSLSLNFIYNMGIL